jgi:hypothetical protein
LLADPALVAKAAAVVRAEDIDHPGLRRLLRGLYDLQAAGEAPTLDNLRADLENVRLAEAAFELQEVGQSSPRREIWLGELLAHFRHRLDKTVKQELQSQLHAANDHQAALDLLRRLQEEAVRVIDQMARGPLSVALILPLRETCWAKPRCLLPRKTSGHEAREGLMEKIDDSLNSLKALLESGKEKGYLTYSQVNDHLPDDDANPEKIDQLLMLLEAEGIELIDEAEVDERERAAGGPLDEDAAAEIELNFMEEDDSRRIDDPVRCISPRWATSRC